MCLCTPSPVVFTTRKSERGKQHLAYSLEQLCIVKHCLGPRQSVAYLRLVLVLGNVCVAVTGLTGSELDLMLAGSSLLTTCAGLFLNPPSARCGDAVVRTNHIV